MKNCTRKKDCSAVSDSRSESGSPSRPMKTPTADGNHSASDALPTGDETGNPHSLTQPVQVPSREGFHGADVNAEDAEDASESPEHLIVASRGVYDYAGDGGLLGEGVTGTAMYDGNARGGIAAGRTPGGESLDASVRPLGLLLARIRSEKIAQWSSLDQMPLENWDVLDEHPEVSQEFEQLREVVLSEMESVLTVTEEIFKVLIEKADENERLRSQLEDLESVKQKNEETIMSLREELKSNAAMWQSKLQHALNELDATEKQLFERDAHSTRITPGREEGSDQDGKGDDADAHRMESLRLIASLKTERSRLRKEVSELGTELRNARERLAETDELPQQYKLLRERHAVTCLKLTAAEKNTTLLTEAAKSRDVEMQAMREAMSEYERKLAETTLVLEALRGATDQDSLGGDLMQTLGGSCLLNELMKDSSNSRFGSNARRPVPSSVAPVEAAPLTELKRERAPPVTVFSSDEVSKDVAAALTAFGEKGKADRTRGGPIHIHVHQHHHAHAHNHIHNHEHFHGVTSLAARRPPLIVSTAANGGSDSARSSTPPRKTVYSRNSSADRAADSAAITATPSKSGASSDTILLVGSYKSSSGSPATQTDGSTLQSGKDLSNGVSARSAVSDWTRSLLTSPEKSEARPPPPSLRYSGAHGRAPPASENIAQAPHLHQTKTIDGRFPLGVAIGTHFFNEKKSVEEPVGATVAAPLFYGEDKGSHLLRITKDLKGNLPVSSVDAAMLNAAIV